MIRTKRIIYTDKYPSYLKKKFTVFICKDKKYLVVYLTIKEEEVGGLIPVDTSLNDTSLGYVFGELDHWGTNNPFSLAGP